MLSSRLIWRGCAALAAFVMMYAILAYGLHAVSAPIGAAPAASSCSFSQHQLVDEGKGLGGDYWTIKGAVRNSDGCNRWLLAMEFRPTGGRPGSSLWRWAIPAGGHLSNSFTISAQDQAAGTVRAIFGTVGARISRVVAKMSQTKALEIHPKLPARALRQRFAWLRNMRYFILFYPAGREVKSVTLLGDNGDVVEKLGGQEGSFEGPGV